MTRARIATIFSYPGFLSVSVFPAFTHICDCLTSTEHRITKKFELESEEEKKKLSDSYSAIFENFNQEKEVTQPKAYQWLKVQSGWDVRFPEVPQPQGKLFVFWGMILLSQLPWEYMQADCPSFNPLDSLTPGLWE